MRKKLIIIIVAFSIVTLNSCDFNKNNTYVPHSENTTSISTSSPKINSSSSIISSNPTIVSSSSTSVSTVSKTTSKKSVNTSTTSSISNHTSNSTSSNSVTQSSSQSSSLQSSSQSSSISESLTPLTQAEIEHYLYMMSQCKKGYDSIMSSIRQANDYLTHDYPYEQPSSVYRHQLIMLKQDLILNQKIYQKYVDIMNLHGVEFTLYPEILEPID